MIGLKILRTERLSGERDAFMPTTASEFVSYVTPWKIWLGSGA